MREAFAQGAHVPARHVHAIESGGAHGTSLIMPAWNERGYFGVKVINIFPENTRQSLPGLHATYNLYSARSGVRRRRRHRHGVPHRRRGGAGRFTWRGRTPPCC